MGSTPLGVCIGSFLKNLLSKFRFHIKDSKWGRKFVFMNYASYNRSPQQIQLRQLPFANEGKPHSHYREFWALSFFKGQHKILQEALAMFCIGSAKKRQSVSCRPLEWENIWVYVKVKLFIIKDWFFEVVSVFSFDAFFAIFLILNRLYNVKCT